LGAFAYAGQVCISVQRVYVARGIYDRFKELLLKETAALKVGEAEDESTDVGPLISEGDALRVEGLIREAVKAGASVLCGGLRNGRYISPAWLEGAPENCAVNSEEVFGPVATLAPVASAEEGMTKINDSRFGLQAGVFTRDLSTIMAFWRGLDVGGLVVNDVPTFRSDAMPYGGTKDSGIGREGVRCSIEEFTEPRTLVLRG
jgi:acyl-CoA reductase-like NAD-dependent aldehyde dehydrogenase